MNMVNALTMIVNHGLCHIDTKLNHAIALCVIVLLNVCAHIVIVATTRRRKGKHAMTNTKNATRAKANTQSREIPTITLSSIIRDIYRDNANATITDKKARARLRVVYRDEHVHNTSWVFTQSRAHDVRIMFDDAYRAKFERAQKRATTTRATSRKAKTQTHDAIVNDANDASE